MVSCLFCFRNRKKIAKYKAAAAMAQKSEGEELLVISPLKDNGSSIPSPSPDSVLEGKEPSQSNGEMTELKAGNIVVTWKDGNASCLYSDPTAEKEKQEEVSAAELEADEAEKTIE